MATDIRISLEFWDHPKTRKLESRLGLESVKNLQILWMWAAKNRPQGEFTGMDLEDIELASRWTGERGLFASTLLDLRLLERHEITEFNESLTARSTKNNGVDFVIKIHDWRSHNPWAAESETRSEKARFSRLAFVCPEVHSALMQTGQVSITKAEYEQVLAKYMKDKPVNMPKQREKRNGTTNR